MKNRFLAIAIAFAAAMSISSSASAQVAEPTVHSHDGAVLTVSHKGSARTQYPSNDTVETSASGRPNILRLTITPRGCRKASCKRMLVQHNARVSAGAVAIAQDIGTSTNAPFNYVALSTDSTAVANGDTACPSEITTSGLARKQATVGAITAPSSLGGTASYTLTASWTATAATTVTKICALNAVSSGTLGFETILGSSVSLNAGDSLSLSYSFQV